MVPRRLLAVAVAAVLSLPLLRGETVRRIDTEVTLLSDGSARIVQVWDVDATKGTEWYIPVGSLLEGMKIRDFSVSEGGVRFASDGNSWDIDRSRDEKRNRCGMVLKRDGSYELCWGIGSFGDHVFTVSYTLDALVQSFTDGYEGFLHKFVNDGLSAKGATATLTLKDGAGRPFEKDSTLVWGFGYRGTVDFPGDGTILLSAPNFSDDEKIILMCRFPKGTYSTSYNRGMTFASLRDKALEGSSFEDDRTAGDKIMEFFFKLCIILCVLLGFGVVAFVIISSALGYKYKKSLFGTRKIDTWYREAPLGGDLPSNLWVLENGGRFGSSSLSSNLIGAYFMKWLFEGKVTSRQDERHPGRINLVLGASRPEFGSEIENELYDIILEAAGDNRLLERNEFEKWATKHESSFLNWIKKAKQAGGLALKREGKVDYRNRAVEPAQAELRRVIEFKNFLNDYTLIGERSTSEVKLWQNYLIFASLFGIAKKVADQMKQLYPDTFETLSETVGSDVSRTVVLTNRMSNDAFARATFRHEGTSRAGGGGFSSFGGGGGFSGGGFGGGGR